MTAITDFRHPLEKAALELANRWCAGQQIAGRRALVHALEVAGTLRLHVPGIGAEVVAAVLLHDTPDFVPAHVDLYAVLAARLSPEVARIVHALEDEHATMNTDRIPELVEDRPVLLASTADKLVSLAAALQRPGGPPQALLHSVGYFEAFAAAAGPRLPPSMATDLARLVDDAGRA